MTYTVLKKASLKFWQLFILSFSFVVKIEKNEKMDSRINLRWIANIFIYSISVTLPLWYFLYHFCGRMKEHSPAAVSRGSLFPCLRRRHCVLLGHGRDRVLCNHPSSHFSSSQEGGGAAECEQHISGCGKGANTQIWDFTTCQWPPVGYENHLNHLIYILPSLYIFKSFFFPCPI